MIEQQVPKPGDIVILNDVIGYLVNVNSDMYTVNTTSGIKRISTNTPCVCFAEAKEIAALYAKRLLEVIHKI